MIPPSERAFGRAARIDEGARLYPDDAHIFARRSIESETAIFIDLLSMVYKDFGLKSSPLNFRPIKSARSDEVWDRGRPPFATPPVAGVPTNLNPGEGAFYDRNWNSPFATPSAATGKGDIAGGLRFAGTFDAHYIGEDDARHRPVILHRAILGSSNASSAF